MNSRRLSGHEQLVSWYPRCSDHLTDGPLIAVESSRIDQPVTGLKRGWERGTHLVLGHPEHTHAQRGHLDAIVEGNHLWTFLTGFAFTLQADQPILREMLVLSRPTPVCWWRGEDREIEV